MENAPLAFALEDNPHETAKKINFSWKILIVDDEASVHDIIKIVLNDFVYRTRPVAFINAFSGEEAKALFRKHPDTALMLVDVVMETESLRTYRMSAALTNELQKRKNAEKKLQQLNQAIKFTEKGYVKISVVPLRIDNKSADLKFEIKDTGIGISHAFQKKLFTKFSREDTSITRKFDGTGLGLAISKNLAELMNGKIEVSSTPQKGTVFTVFLKLDIYDGEACPSLPDSYKTAPPLQNTGLPATDKKIRILVAEDNPVNQRVTLIMLKKTGNLCRYC